MKDLINLSICIVVVTSILIIHDLKNWEKQERVIEWDIHSYYAYLPAIFIYGDIKLVKDDYKFDTNFYLFWPNKLENGNNAIKTTLGVSIFYAPFFFIAHGFALLTEYPENGFSEPYKLLLLMSSVFFLFVGLIYLKKSLLFFGFTDKVIAITILLIGLGTNLLAYSSQSAPMSHVYSFALFSMFIYYTCRWYKSPDFKNSVLIGSIFGLITLVRPTNGIILLFFVLYNINNKKEFLQKIQLLFKKTKYLLIFLICTIILWIPQFIYWKIVTGEYFYYSYTDERFFFDDPKILQGLFSFRKGWLVYTPIMIFALAGMFCMKQNLKKLRLAVVSFFLINIYIIFSWWCWWYGGTFGQRALIESYAILSLPFAAFVKFIFDRGIYYKFSLLIISLFFIWLNIFQTYQFERHTLHWDGMTGKLYFKQFGEMDRVDDYDKYVSPPNYEEAKFGSKELLEESKKITNEFLNTKEKLRKRVWIQFKSDFLNIDAEGNIFVDTTSRAVFILIHFNESKISLQTEDQKFLTSELNNSAEIMANRSEAGYWETFELVKINSDLVAIKAVNNKYIYVNPGNSRLYANSENTEEFTNFKLVEFD